jgi:FtsZ-binding cell division protein ZapB
MQINSAIGKDGDIIITNNEKDEELPGKVTKYISNSDKKISELESQVEGVKRENTKLYGYLSGVHITLASNSNKTKNHNKNTLDDDYKKLPEEVKSIIAEKNNLKKENKNLKNKQSIRYLRLKLIKKQIEKLT